MDMYQIQTALRLTNRYFGIIDGDCGAQTTAAIRLCQMDNGIVVDGIAGAITQAKLMEQVKAYQSALNTHGYRLEVDGLCGSATDAAFKDFQKKNGLEVDGIVGMQTVSMLLRMTPPVVDTPSHSGGTGDIGYGADAEKISANFTKGEIRCECGGKWCNGFPVNFRRDLANKLQKMRDLCGEPINITSGIRCKEQNRVDKGIVNSFHMQGRAADMYISGWSVDAMARLAQSVGLGVIKYYDLHFIHVEV